MDKMTSLSFRKSYTLLAQTPMIHFQHDQSGATLRVTEVKPKLDRYLRDLLDTVPQSWLIPGQPKALNYQMRITAAEKHKEADSITVRDCKVYFGNLGDGPKKEKELVFRNCCLEINCFIPDLLAFIDKNIKGFFVLHNFGTRQSKGFGGFLVKGFDSPCFVRQTVERHCPHFFFADMPQGTNTLGRMNHALAVYTFLKNGTNQTRYRDGYYGYPKRYIKGFAMRQFLPDGVGSDKAFLKSRVVPAKTPREKDDLGPYKSHTFIRALLGLADHYEFRDDMRNDGIETRIDHRTNKEKTVIKPQKVYVIHFEGAEIRDKKLHIPEDSIRRGLGIKRFRSPILIKIFEDHIYFILDNSWEQMLGQVFLMMPKEDYHRAAKSLDDSLNRSYGTQAERENLFRKACNLFQNAQYICTPASFDPDVFISRFVSYFNRNRGVLRNFPKTEHDKKTNTDSPGVYFYSKDLMLKIGGAHNG